MQKFQIEMPILMKNTDKGTNKNTKQKVLFNKYLYFIKNTNKEINRKYQ